MINSHDKFFKFFINLLKKSITFDKKWDLEIVWKPRKKFEKITEKIKQKNIWKLCESNAFFAEIWSKVITIKKWVLLNWS